jgi:hypothetical protein
MTTPVLTEIDVRSAYVSACAALRDLAQLVVASHAVQYDAPAGMASSKGVDTEVSNPTYDTVVDARRMALSNECRDLASYLTAATASLTTRKARLDRALARWEGDVPQAH